MDRRASAVTSPYEGEQIILATKHAKGDALRDPFKEVLGASVLECQIDTDLFGTFSGETKRSRSPLDTAKRKCEAGLAASKGSYGIASEGSFGPHPTIPFIPSNYEILLFIDTMRNFTLHVSEIYFETNYFRKEISSLYELQPDLERMQFPSHGLLLRPAGSSRMHHLYKGIHSYEFLENAYQEIRKTFTSQHIIVETDMRAHMNPTRMNNIRNLGFQLVERLKSTCPECNAPGWGKSKLIAGLPCRYCERETGAARFEIRNCVKCNYSETHSTEKKHENPRFCPFCNT